MEHRSVVVTGASSGIGRAIALRLASRGFRTFAGVRRSEDGAALVAAAGPVAASLVPLLLDVTDSASLAAAADTVRREAGGGLFGLVNNAGITVAGPIELVSSEALRGQFEVNLFGVVAATKAFLPHLRAKRGRILIMGSILGRFALPFVAPYAASKFALEAIADSLAMELGPWGIAVTLLEAGNVATPIWEKSKQHGEELARAWGDADWALYRGALDSFQRYVERTAHAGIPPERVALVVERALTSRRPRSRYAVGWDARLLGRIAPLLPGRLRQAIVRRVVLSK